MKKEKILYFIFTLIIIMIIFVSCIYFNNKSSSFKKDIKGYWSYYSYYIYDGDNVIDKVEGISGEYLFIENEKMRICAAFENDNLQCTEGTYKVKDSYLNINSKDYVFYGKFSYVLNEDKLILTKTEKNNKYVYTFIGAAG